MKGDKWFESIQYCQSPYPLTAAFSGEVYSDHFYLAYTLIDLPSAPEKCSVQSYVDDTRQVISFKMKDIVNPFERNHILDELVPSASSKTDSPG